MDNHLLSKLEVRKYLQDFMAMLRLRSPSRMIPKTILNVGATHRTMGKDENQHPHCPVKSLTAKKKVLEVALPTIHGHIRAEAFGFTQAGGGCTSPAKKLIRRETAVPAPPRN